MKILADQNIPFAIEAFATLTERDNIVLFDGRMLSAEQLTDVDMLLVRSVTQVNEALLQNSRVRFVGSATIGTDHIDQDYLDRQNIVFANAPGCNATSASEYVLAVLLKYALLNNVPLTDLRIAVVGYGNVGSRVVKKLSALGIPVSIYDPPRAEKFSDVAYVDWQTVKQCNVVTAHVPLTVDGAYPTKNMFNADFFSGLAQQSLFINTSRGAAVDEAALLKELQTKRLHLMLDVWQNEPAINPILVSKTLVSTPHIAGYSYDGKCRGTEMIYAAACRFLNKTPSWDVMTQLQDSQLDPHLKFTSDDVAGLWDLVNQVYRVDEDSARLRDSMSLDAGPRALEFDRQRKEYPKRREFNYYDIRQSDVTTAQGHMLEQLGFRISH